MSLNTISKTASDAITFVKRQFGDESGVQITDTDIIRWINSAQVEIVSRTACLKGKFSTNTVGGQSEYPLPTEQILQIESIHYKRGRVQNIAFADAERTIFEADPNGERTAQRPDFWYEWGGKVTFWPGFTDSTVGGITIYASKMPTLITVSSDLLSLPDKFFEAITAWVMMKAYELDEEFDVANNMRQQFGLMLDDKFGEELVTQHMTYPVITFVD